MLAETDSSLGVDLLPYLVGLSVSLVSIPVQWRVANLITEWYRNWSEHHDIVGVDPMVSGVPISMWALWAMDVGHISSVSLTFFITAFIAEDSFNRLHLVFTICGFAAVLYVWLERRPLGDPSRPLQPVRYELLTVPGISIAVLILGAFAELAT